MFTIDEIQFQHANKDANVQRSDSSKTWVIGGSGTYAALGARLVGGRSAASQVGWILDCGNDFPIEFKTAIEKWHTSCIFRTDVSRLTTRAWNGYGEDDRRAFHFVTPRLRLDETCLSHSHLSASAFHLNCSPQRAIDLVDGILARRRNEHLDRSRPVFVWEPVPDTCVPSERLIFLEASTKVDVVSPNELELEGLFTDVPPSNESAKAAVILDSGVGSNKQGVLVVRAGRHGCRTYYQDQVIQMPAYHMSPENGAESSGMVVDPTGGGNTFLGALGMMLSDDPKQPLFQNLDKTNWEQMKSRWGKFENFPTALACASVAASFAIEQTGVPQIGENEAGEEVWNGTQFEERLHEYVSRQHWQTSVAEKF
ncbi:MAG: hypothetical protein Q9227_001556 [Pyrenula ochraceoflavens]